MNTILKILIALALIPLALVGITALVIFAATLAH